MPTVGVETVRVDARCTACGLCTVTCPTGALIPHPGRPAVVDHRCTGCWACVEVCPRDALTPTRLVPAPRAGTTGMDR
jgi:ferredoxin